VDAYYETDASVAGKPFTIGAESVVQELLDKANARNVFREAPGLAPQVSFEAIVRADPDVILLADAVGHVGPHFFGAISERSVRARAGFDQVAAVRDDRVVAIDADALLIPGPHLAEGFAQLVAALHPDHADEAREAVTESAS
jgi:iron complex transport system substrate-binding protein